MADIFTQKYIYPANWPGSNPGQEGPGLRHVEVLLSFRASTTAGQTGVVILRPEDWTLPGPGGICPPCKRIGLARAQATLNGKVDYVRLYWDRRPNEDLHVFGNDGAGPFDYQYAGGLWDNTDAVDDGPGNILLDSVVTAANGAYSLKLDFILGE